MSQLPKTLSLMKMNREFCLIFPIGVLVIICIHSVHSQGLCLDGRTPFKSEAESSFCSMYENYGCCAEKENADLSIRFTRLANVVPSHVWRNCSSYAQTFLCQSCSPYAAFLHEAVPDVALKRIPRKFPGLCEDFCNKFYEECKDLVKYYLEDVEDKKTPTKEKQTLLAALEDSLDAFCKMVELQDNKYCYPGLINMTNVKTGFVNKPDPGNRPYPVNKTQIKIDPLHRSEQVTKPHFMQNSYIQTRFFSQSKNKTRVKKRAADDVDCLCVEKIASNLRMPLFLKHANDGSNRLFIGEQIGVIHIYYPDGTKVKKPFLDITSRVKKMTSIEQGMTGMAFHPNFKSNGYFYVYFSTPKDKSKVNHYSNVGEFRVSSKDINKADPDYFRLVFQIPQPKGVHNGGEMLFGVDYFLYLFLGDGGKQGDPDGNAQNMESYLGKVLRIDVNKRTGDKGYGIPPDNPFQGPLPDGTVPHPEIFALGLRNPWRCGVDLGDRITGEGYGRIMCGDVGQSKVEEIDLIEKGANYGWNKKEGNQNYCSKCKLAPVGELKNPIFDYHRNTRFGKSVIGGQFYRGCMYPNLNGMFLWGDFNSGMLFRLLENEDTGKWENQELEMCSSCIKPFSDSYEQNILSFGSDENGEVYLLSSQGVSSKKKKGSVYRLVDPSRQADPEACTLDQKSASSIQPSSTQNTKQEVKETNNSNNDKKGQKSTTEEKEGQTVSIEDEGQIPKVNVEASFDALQLPIQAATSITVPTTSSTSTTVPTTSSTSTTVPTTSSTTTVPTTSSTSTTVPTTSSTSTTVPTTSSTTTVPTSSSTSTTVPTTSSTSTTVPTTSITTTVPTTTVPTTSSTPITVPTTSSTSTTVPTTSSTSTTIPITTGTPTTAPTTSITSTTIPITSSTSTTTSSSSTIIPTSQDASTNSKSTPKPTASSTVLPQPSNIGVSSTTATPSSAATSISTAVHSTASITPSVQSTVSTSTSTSAAGISSRTGFEEMSSHFQYILDLLRVAKARATSSSAT